MSSNVRSRDPRREEISTSDLSASFRAKGSFAVWPDTMISQPLIGSFETNAATVSCVDRFS